MENGKISLVKLCDELLVPKTSGFESLNIAGVDPIAIYGIRICSLDVSSNHQAPKGTVPARSQILLCTTTERKIMHRMEPFLPCDVNLFFRTLRQVTIYISFNNLKFNIYILQNNIMPVFPYLDNNGIKRVAFVDNYYGKNLLLSSGFEEFKKMEYEHFPQEFIMPIPPRRALFLLDKN